MNTAFPRQPIGLLRGGRNLWQSVRDRNYVLRPDELRVLEDACREVDLIDALEARLRACVKAGEFTVKGSMGQQVINPLISEVRQHRSTLASMLARLRLPDAGDDSAVAGPAGRGEQQRNAAAARWAIPHQAV